MMKRTLHRYAALVAKVVLIAQPLVLLPACQQGDDSEPQPRNTQVPLSLYSGITSSITRAYDATWETNDQIGVFTVVAGQTDASNITYSGSNLDANIPYTATAGATYPTGSVASASYNASSQTYNSFSPSVAANKIYLPLDGSNVDVYAYYPYQSSLTNYTFDITIPTDQNNVNSPAQKTYDLMKASVLSSTTPINIDHPSAKLLFEHCLTKVLVKVKVGIGYSVSDLNGISVKIIGQPTAASVTPISANPLSVTANQTGVDIVPLTLTGSDSDWGSDSDVKHAFRALLLPTTAATNPDDETRKIVLTVGSGTTTTTYSYTITNNLAAGHETVFTLTLQATGITVTAAITPWSTESVTPDDPLTEES